MDNKENNKTIKAPKKLKLLFSIVERTKVDFYLQVLEGYGVNLQTVTYARGTASNEMLKHYGFVDNSKALILSIVPEEKVKEILIAFEDRIYRTKNGKGLAFTIPFDSIIGLQLYEILAGLSFKEEM